MSNSLGGAENANDRLSSNSCLRDVAVGMSSSKIGYHGVYLQGDWMEGIVLLRCFYGSAWLL